MGSCTTGLVLPVRHRPRSYGYDTILRLAEYADAQPGWNTLWTADSIMALPFLDSGVLLAALAARTRRARLGIGCLASLGFRHPVTVARQWADLDQLSHGRMLLAACPGNGTGTAVENELRTFGMDYAEKVARFEESVTFLRAVSTGATSFHGPFTQVENLDLGAGFVQRPLPTWIAANPSPRAGRATVDRLLGRVARLGTGWMTFNVTPELLRQRVERLHELGPGPFEVCVFLNTNVGLDQNQVLADARERWFQTAPRGVSVDDLDDIAAVGSPEAAADLIGRLAEAGATHLAIEPLSTDVPAQVGALTELLLPRLDLTTPTSASTSERPSRAS
ncbi:LLM class flavin-dependent oxidoreductase [Kineosporia succinea]|uniref:Alkanesulfonate monooxygenase SsuD/methylene tetrahydromethanopterin reductase-like flavin-dependent oxidoreductase (Luciferase family) n=1 Tax=Kineosporia succinea TaxID=84632 RepID=A0ABT9P8Q7_9ACTN|nr:LLM class flavin-dependent oxidoreductase [Kineosporia succinea]MDP9829084.1 alkanesulfonate monooxygenase SsuD/methylene tetrahydromethanopterin reductase-like flavin-dependent oxidoreductase (luciferase family) [Kineosporia succinea]